MYVCANRGAVSFTTQCRLHGTEQSICGAWGASVEAALSATSVSTSETCQVLHWHWLTASGRSQQGRILHWIINHRPVAGMVLCALRTTNQGVQAVKDGYTTAQTKLYHHKRPGGAFHKQACTAASSALQPTGPHDVVHNSKPAALDTLARNQHIHSRYHSFCTTMYSWWQLLDCLVDHSRAFC